MVQKREGSIWYWMRAARMLILAGAWSLFPTAMMTHFLVASPLLLALAAATFTIFTFAEFFRLWRAKEDITTRRTFRCVSHLAAGIASLVGAIGFFGFLAKASFVMSATLFSITMPWVLAIGFMIALDSWISVEARLRTRASLFSNINTTTKFNFFAISLGITALLGGLFLGFPVIATVFLAVISANTVVLGDMLVAPSAGPYLQVWEEEPSTAATISTRERSESDVSTQSTPGNGANVQLDADPTGSNLRQ